MKDGQIILEEGSGKRFLITEVEEEVGENITDDSIKVAVVVGHHEASKGDYSDRFKEHEYDYWCKFASYLKQNGLDVFLITHDPTINSYTERQKRTAALTNHCDLVFELHWNAFDPDGDGNDDAEGTECLVWHTNDLMRRVGHYFCSHMEGTLGFHNRGVKLIDSGNGAGFLKETRGDAILLEFFFADNNKDVNLWDVDAGLNAMRATINYYKSIKDKS